MTGLEKMESQILEEANTSAKELLDKAQVEADKIMKTAQAAAKKKTDDIALRSAADVENYRDRIKSNADLQRRKAILVAKQEVISETMEKAYEKFFAQSNEEYYETVKKMVELFAQPEAGTICFSNADKSLFKSDFIEELNKIAQKKGGSLVLSDENRKIDKGFVLIYGGIEENCSFRAIFDAKQNELQDLIQQEIFS